MGHFFESGFSVREPAWHGLAEVLDEYPGRKEGRKLAGHDWEPEKRQLFIGPDEGVPNIPVPGWSALIRSDSQAVIGCVKDTYTVISNETVWDIVDALAKQEKVKYETAGVLKGGGDRLGYGPRRYPQANPRRRLAGLSVPDGRREARSRGHGGVGQRDSVHLLEYRERCGGRC